VKYPLVLDQDRNKPLLFFKLGKSPLFSPIVTGGPSRALPPPLSPCIRFASSGLPPFRSELHQDLFFFSLPTFISGAISLPSHLRRSARRILPSWRSGYEFFYRDKFHYLFLTGQEAVTAAIAFSEGSIPFFFLLLPTSSALFSPVGMFFCFLPVKCLIAGSTLFLFLWPSREPAHFSSVLVDKFSHPGYRDYYSTPLFDGWLSTIPVASFFSLENTQFVPLFDTPLPSLSVPPPREMEKGCSASLGPPSLGVSTASFFSFLPPSGS